MTRQVHSATLLVCHFCLIVLSFIANSHDWAPYVPLIPSPSGQSPRIRDCRGGNLREPTHTMHDDVGCVYLPPSIGPVVKLIQ